MNDTTSCAAADQLIEQKAEPEVGQKAEKGVVQEAPTDPPASPPPKPQDFKSWVAELSYDERRRPDFVLRVMFDLTRFPAEYRERFSKMFACFETMYQGSAETPFEYALALEITKLMLNIEQYERNKRGILKNLEPAAAKEMLWNAEVLFNSERSPDRVVFEPDSETWEYFNPDDDAYRKDADISLAEFGYATNAVEAEAFRQALPMLKIIDQQLTSWRKQVFAMLKDLEKSVQAGQKLIAAAKKGHN